MASHQQYTDYQYRTQEMWFSDDDDDDDDVQRPTWNIVQFGFSVLSCMTLAVFTRFPMNHYFGSGWAVVMYVVFLFVFAAPMVYIQLKLGCHYRHGLLGIFDKFFPLSLGFGIGTMIRNLISIVYISGIMAQCLSYLFFSAWPCDGRLCVGAKFIWGSCEDEWNKGDCEAMDKAMRRGPTAEDGFYYHFVLSRTNDITYSGDFPRWFERDGLPVIPHIIVWVFFTLTVVGGAKIFGYILYGVASLASVLLFVVLGFVFASYGNSRGQLDNFMERFFKNFASNIPVSTTAYDQFRFYPLVWGLLSTFVQMSMSMNLYTGVYPLLGKYLGRGRKRENFAWILVIVIFGIMGLLPTLLMVAAYASSYEMDYLRCHVSQGFATPFVILTHVFTKFSTHRTVPFIFFLSFFLFLLLSQALLFIVVLEGILDRLRQRSRQVAKHMRRSYFIGCAIALPILFTLSFTTVIRSGYYWMYLMDYYMDRLFVFIVVGVSVGLVVAHGRSPLTSGITKILMVTFLIITTVISMGIFVWHAADASQPDPSQNCEFLRLSSGPNPIPSGFRAIGWLLAVAPFLIGVPIGLFNVCCRKEEDAEAMPFWPYIVHGEYMSPTEYMEDYPRTLQSQSSRGRPYSTEMTTMESRTGSRGRFSDI